jgi:hypothetical protein
VVSKDAGTGIGSPANAGIWRVSSYEQAALKIDGGLKVGIPLL